MLRRRALIGHVKRISEGSLCRTSGGSSTVAYHRTQTSNASKVSTAIRCPTDLRMMEYETFSARVVTEESFKDLRFSFYFDLRPYTQEEASFSIIKTAFICVVLCVASLMFSRDANQLVLKPVEQMITKVEAIRDNPLVATKIADDEFKREEMLRMRCQRVRNGCAWKESKEESDTCLGRLFGKARFEVSADSQQDSFSTGTVVELVPWTQIWTNIGPADRARRDGSRHGTCKSPLCFPEIPSYPEITKISEFQNAMDSLMLLMTCLAPASLSKRACLSQYVPLWFGARKCRFLTRREVRADGGETRAVLLEAVDAR